MVGSQTKPEHCVNDRLAKIIGRETLIKIIFTDGAALPDAPTHKINDAFMLHSSTQKQPNPPPPYYAKALPCVTLR
jgi:hypothetical protein